MNADTRRFVLVAVLTTFLVGAGVLALPNRASAQPARGQAFVRVTLERVIDADTLVVLQPVACPEGSRRKECALIRTCRLARVNAPELRTPEGRRAKAAVADVLNDGLARPRQLRARFLGREKYGRDLCEIEVRTELVRGDLGQVWLNLSDWLLERGHAKPYREAER